MRKRLRALVVRHYPHVTILLLIGAVVCLDRVYRKTMSNPVDIGMRDLQGAKYDDAIAQFQQAVRFNPSDTSAQFQLGYAYNLKGWLDEALPQYEMVAGKAAELANFAYHNEGVILQGKGQLEQAEIAYQNSLQVNPRAGNSLHNLLLIYEAKNEHDKALRACQAYLDAAPGDTNILLTAGDIAGRLGKPDLARQYYRNALAVDPNFAPAKSRLGMLSAK